MNMSFLDKVKSNRANAGVNNNPFASKKVSESSTNTNINASINDPFAPKAMSNAGAKPSLGGMKPNLGTKPSLGGMKPGAGAKPSFASPSMAKPMTTPSVTPSTPKVEEVKTEEIKETVKVEETVAPVTPATEEVKVEEVKEPKATVEEKKEEVASKKETKEEVVEEIKEEVKEETKEAKEAREKKARTRSTSKKKAEPKTAEMNSEEITLTEALFKMPNTTLSFAEAVSAITNNFVDEEWENYRKEMLAESDSIVIEADMQEGAIKKTIAQLSKLREKVWLQFSDTKTLFETISNKDTEGLIERVKYANYEGSNEIIRKKNGVIAALNYKTPEGEVVNLYQVYDEAKSKLYFLKALMDTIQYKTQVLITMSAAVKLEKTHFNNQ